MLSRRKFVQDSIAVGASFALSSAKGVATPPHTAVAPLAFAPLPLGQVRPGGWLLRQLTLQANSLSGHLDETWSDVGPTSGWLGGTGDSFERGPYWLDGLVPLAYLLNDERLKSKIQPWIEWVLLSQQPDGNFGPKTKSNDWWPRMVMLKVLTQYQEATLDQRVIPFLQRYFAYQRKFLPSQPLRTWAKFRWQDNVLSVVWLYDRAPDVTLVDLTSMLEQQGFNWQAQFTDFRFTGPTPVAFLKEMMGPGGYHETHGVDIAMGLKSAAVWSRISHLDSARRSTAQMLNVLDRYHGLPNGLYSASEHLAGRDPSQGTELCTVVEIMYSLEQAIAAGGDLSLANRLEMIAFNALPGAISYDMWSHQYDQQPNQIECTHLKRPWDNGPDANLFGLAPNYGCCTANFNQGWPKFASSLWMRSPDGGLAAIVYAPCEINTSIGDASVQLEVITDYPFRSVIRIHVRADGHARFPLHLRVPESGVSSLRINGVGVHITPTGGSLKLRRRWSHDDLIEMEVVLQAAEHLGVGGSISFKRGPLLFSLPIEEKWTKLRYQGLTADWQVTGESHWQYAVPSGTTIATEEHEIADLPFGHASPPVSLQVIARPTSNWAAVQGNAGAIPQTPEFGAASEQTVRLVPYACTKLRITAFPAMI